MAESREPRDSRESRERDHKDRDSGFTDHVISVRRVTKVTHGGKRFQFSALVASGNKQGSVGIASGKGREVSAAIAKATNRARKSMITVAMRETTIPYDSVGRHGASTVVVRPASRGTGNKAGGAVRAILDAAGVVDILTKALGSANRVNVAKATLNALAQVRSVNHMAKLRGKTVKQLVKGSDNV